MKDRASFLRDSVFVLLVVDTLLLFVFLLSGKYVKYGLKDLLQNYNNVREHYYKHSAFSNNRIRYIDFVCEKCHILIALY